MTECNSADDSDRATTAIIGLVFLVGLAVVLAAIVGVMAIQMVQDSEPEQTQPWAEQIPETDFDVERVGDRVIVTHAGGESIEATAVEIRGDVDPDPAGFDGYTVSEDDSVMVDLTAAENATVRVVWATPYTEEQLTEREV